MQTQLRLTLLMWCGLMVAVLGGRSLDSDLCQFVRGIYTSLLRRTHHQGFHRNLQTDIEMMLTTSSLPDNCEMLVIETISSGLYVDSDQIRDLQEFTGIRVNIPEFVDIEKPEHTSKSHIFYVYSQPNITENLRTVSVTVPIHLRYHLPIFHDEDNQGYSQAHVPNPRILLRCSEFSLEKECPERQVKAPCNERSSSGQCTWMDLPYRTNTPGLRLLVPVGNTEHTPLVVLVTCLVTCGGCLYLLGALYKKPVRG